MLHHNAALAHYNESVGAPSQVIQSRQNEQIKKLRRALQRGERTPEGLLALDTFHLLEEALASRAEIEHVYHTAEAEPGLRAMLEQSRAQPPLTRLPARLFAAMSALPAAQGVVALVRPRSWQVDDLFRPAPALVVVLAGVQDPGNAGTILRTAEAFGATGALLLHGTVHPENPKLMRASAGSVFRLPHSHGFKYGEALEVLRQHGAHLYAAMPRAKRTLRDVDFRRPVALAIGSEGAGVPDAIRVASESIGIPHTARVESLNAAIAAAIFLYHAAGARRRG